MQAWGIDTCAETVDNIMMERLFALLTFSTVVVVVFLNFVF